MKHYARFVGFDVHKDTILPAVQLQAFLYILFRRLAVIDEIMVRPAILADLDFGSG